MGRVKEVESDLTKANTTAVLEVPGVPNIQDCFFPFSCYQLSYHVMDGVGLVMNGPHTNMITYAKNVIVATP